MFTALLAAVSMAKVFAPITLDLEPTDNVWVYSHASDPASDPYLRAWGSEGKSVAPSAGEMDEFSYSYLRFDLSAVPANAKLKEATLTLVHIPNPVWTLDLAKGNPLEARALGTGFTEKTWTYEDSIKLMPVGGKEGLYGSAAPDKVPEPEKEIAIVINLAGSDEFKTALGKSSAGDRALGIALTSTMEAQAIGGKSVNKVYSKHGPSGKHPVLHLVFEN